jgi:hypothetical protein
MKAVIILLALFIAVPIAKAFFGEIGALVAFFTVLSIPVFIDINKSFFINGRVDKIIFIILTIVCTPLAYTILSYGHKINLTEKQKETFQKLERYSIATLAFIVLILGLITIIEPNVFGIQFIIMMGITILGVIFFHGLYPNHWELYEKKEHKKHDKLSSLFLIS